MNITVTYDHARKWERQNCSRDWIDRNFRLNRNDPAYSAHYNIIEAALFGLLNGRGLKLA